MPDTIQLVKGGHAVDVPVDQAGQFLLEGYAPESDEAQLARNVQEDRIANAPGRFVSGSLGVARGLTLGLSDVAGRAIGGDTYEKFAGSAREAHPDISAAGNVAGAVLPALFTGGESAGVSAGELTGEGLGGVRSLMAATPTGMVAGLGSKIAGLGEGAGVLGRVGATAAAGATEGAIQNAGGYVSDVALGDRKLTADGFVGAMGQGALWGGVAGGALSLSSEGLTAARRLFPASEMTAEAATNARQAATQEMRLSLADSNELSAAAEQKLTEMADLEATTNPGFKQRMQDIKLKAAQDIADARVRIAEMKAQSVEKSIAEKAGKRTTKPAMDFLKQFEVPADEGGLMGQLAATKAAVDGGQTLADIRAAVAEVNPEAAKINSALIAAKDSKQAMADWMEKYGGDSMVAYDAASPAARKAKIANWAKTAPVGDEAGQVAQAHFLSDPENMGARLGGESSPEVQKAANEAGAEAAHRAYLEGLPQNANVSVSGTELMARTRFDAERAAAKAQDEVHQAARAGVPKTPTGDEIIGAHEPVSAKIEKALKTKSADFNDDIAQTAPMITRHEAAHADLTEALGQDAPMGSQERSKLFREAQRASEMKATEQVQAMSAAVEKASPTSLGKQMLGKVSNAAQMYEALRMMGVPLPNPHNIPVVGPMLSAYLKAKLLGKAFGRFGGRVGATAETAIAEKAAMMRQKMFKAIDAGLGVAAKATGKAALVGGGPAAILGHTLFSDGNPKQTQPAYTSAPAKGSVGELYLARAAEVNAAMRPGAIADAIQSRIQTSDPEALQEIIATKERQLQYIAKEMPRPSSPPGVLDDRIWLPSKDDLATWTQCIHAVENPGDVMERAARGQASAKEVEAVANVYPSLYADAQQHLMKQVADGKGRDLTATQRAQLSRTWGLPLSSASTPERTAWLQMPSPHTAPPPQPMGGMGQPTIAGPVQLGQRTLTRIDGG